MKWTEKLKCSVSPSYAYTRGISAAREQDYETCAQFLSRIEEDSHEQQGAINFAGTLAAGLLSRTEWWEKNRDQIDHSVVKRIEGITDTAKVRTESPEAPAGKTEITGGVPEENIKMYLQGMIHALKGEFPQAKKTFNQAWFQHGSTIFTGPLEGLYFMTCLSDSKIPVQTWIEAAGSVTGRVPDLNEMTTLPDTVKKDKPRTAARGAVCHSCWSISSVLDFSANRGCPYCGGKLLSTKYHYTYNAKGINFNGQKLIIGLNTEKLPPHDTIKNEFAMIFNDPPGIGCIAGIIDFSKMLAAAGMK